MTFSIIGVRVSVTRGDPMEWNTSFGSEAPAVVSESGRRM